MKTQSSKFASLVIGIAVMAVLIFLASCTSSAQKANGNPPAVDINTAAYTGNVEALNQHIRAGSDLNEKDQFGGNPLLTAALFGKTEIAKALIDAGADLNFQNKEGSTPLHIAAFFCRPEIVKMLLARGADKTIKNSYGSTAYQSVAGPFGEVKGIYDTMVQMIGPLGLKLDYVYVEKTRPEIAALLQPVTGNR